MAFFALNNNNTLQYSCAKGIHLLITCFDWTLYSKGPNVCLPILLFTGAQEKILLNSLQSPPKVSMHSYNILPESAEQRIAGKLEEVHFLLTFTYDFFFLSAYVAKCTSCSNNFFINVSSP